MVNGTRSSHRIRDEENNSENGKIKLHSNNVSDTSGSGLRRSTRETLSSKKIIPSPSSSTRKKAIPAVKSNSVKVSEKKMPSLWRRSERTRSHSSSSTSDYRSSGSLSSSPKPRKEKSVRQLTFEAKQVNGSEEYEVGTPQVEVKRMTARMYRALFELPKEEPSRIDKSSQDGNDDGGKIGGCSKGNNPDCKEVSKNGALPSEDGNSKEMRVDSGLSGPVKDLVENSDVSAMLAKGDNCNSIPDGSLSRLGGNFMGADRPSNAAIHETDLVAERAQPDDCRQETLQMLPSSSSMLDEDLIRNSVGHESNGEKLAPSKRKGVTVDMDSDVSATLAKDDNCNLIPEGSIPSRLGGNIMEIDGSCSKRIRLDYNLTVSESCNPSATELQDGEHINPSMRKKDSQIDNEKEAGLITNSCSSVIQPKERLSSHTAYRCEFDSVNFVEYWVPVHISNVQLEQYCDILLKNASVLRSSSKGDSGEAVRDVLNSARKCCSHPYLVFPGLKHSLNKDIEPVEYLEFDLKVSGKLQLLDSMLKELRKNDLRVLILFQSIGGSGRVIGNYLDDLLLQRFGPDSYERVDKSLPASKKQAAMKIFNDKNNKRFVFLLETCACLPSIKLSSVDTVIIFDSDWNPLNDIRSLQKLTLDSQFEFIKIFRLYSSFTVEEKALILAKQYNKPLDINLQNVNWFTSHMLLMWGASYLFDELKVFHDGETSATNVKSLFGRSLLKEAMHEFSSLLSRDGEHIDSSNCSTLLKVQQDGITYHANFPLLGELTFRELDKDPPQFFWAKLLEGKQFQWKYFNSSSQRSRKKVHHFDGSVNGPDLVSEGAAKKRRKVSNNIVDQPSSKFEGEKLSTGIKAGTSGDLVDRSQGNNFESQQKSRQHDERRNLHISLKPEITKLCDVLLLPDNVKSMIDDFLEYVMNNHHVIVNREPLSILQAFQLSLCWTAASLLKHKLDHKNSLKDAENNLNFVCKIEEVDYIYSRLRCLKKIFLYRTGSYNDVGSPKASELSNRAYSCTGVALEVELFEKDISKSIKEIKKKCEKNLKKLQLLQEEEKQRLRKAFEEKKETLESKYKIESAFIRSCSPNDVTRMEKLRLWNIEHEKRIEKLKCQHEMCLKDLEDKQLAEIQKFQEKEATWVEDVKSWAQEELGTGVESLQTCDQVQPHNGLKNHFAEGKRHDDKFETMRETVTKNSPLSDKRIANRATVNLFREEVSGQHGTVNITACPDNGTVLNAPPSMEQRSDGGAVNEFSDREVRQGSSPDNTTLLSPWHQISDGVRSSILDGHISVEVQETSSEVDTVCVLKGVPVETPGMVNFTDCPQNDPPLNPPSSMDQISDRDPLEAPVLDRGLSPRACQAASSSDGPVTIPISNPLLEQQATDGVPLSIPAVADCHDDIEHLTNDVLVDKRTMSDQQEGAPKTMAELSQETPVSRSLNVMDPPAQVQQLSVESSSDHDTSGGMQHSSEQPELISSAVDVVTADQSNHVSLIVKPLELVHQLPSAELPSSHLNSTNFPLATEVEHQPTVVPNQDVQLDPNSELDSHSQEVVHPASNSDPDTVTPSEVRMQSSDTINLSTPLEINYRQMQAETHSASRVPRLGYDPLKNELDRIQKEREQTMKCNEDMKLRLKTNFEKELEELRRKYDVKFQEIEVEFKQTKMTLDTSLNAVRMNQLLADAFRSKCSTLKASGTLQDSSFAQQQLVQPSRQQSASWPSLVAGSSSCGPSATHLQSPSPTASSQLTAPPIRAGYGTPGFVSNVSPRLPINNTIPSISNVSPRLPINNTIPSISNVSPRLPINNTIPSISNVSPRLPINTTIPSVSKVSPRLPTDNTIPSVSNVSLRLPIKNTIPSLGNLRAGGEIRAPAPHLQPYKP